MVGTTTSTLLDIDTVHVVLLLQISRKDAHVHCPHDEGLDVVPSGLHAAPVERLNNCVALRASIDAWGIRVIPAEHIQMLIEAFDMVDLRNQVCGKGGVLPAKFKIWLNPTVMNMNINVSWKMLRDVPDIRTSNARRYYQQQFETQQHAGAHPVSHQL